MDRMRRRFRILVALTLVTIAVGTVTMHFLEGLSWIDSCYFSVVTLATVGYGDIAPRTDAGKLFTIGYIVMGVGIIGAFINFRVKYRAERYVEHHHPERQVDGPEFPSA